MKRLFVMACLCLFVGDYADSRDHLNEQETESKYATVDYPMSDCAKADYWAKKGVRSPISKKYLHWTLAVAKNGCFKYVSAFRKRVAKSYVVKSCAQLCGLPCKLLDTNFRSAFIRNRGPCDPLAESSSSGSYCYSPLHRVFTKRGSMNNWGCLGGERIITKAEYDNKRLNSFGSATTASSSSATASSSSTRPGWCSEPTKSGGRLYQRIATKCKGKIFETYAEAAAEYNRAHGIVYPEIGPYDTIWCANKITVAEYKKWNCDEIGGTAHRSKSLAQAEHKRLKSASSVASSSSSSTSVYPNNNDSTQIWCLIGGIPIKNSLYRTKGGRCWQLAGKEISDSNAKLIIGKGSVYCYYPKNKVWYWTTGSCPSGEREVTVEEYYSLWCAVKGWSTALQMGADRCDSNKGTAFATRSEAEAELQRLKDGTSTASADSSSTASSSSSSSTTSSIDQVCMDRLTATGFIKNWGRDKAVNICEKTWCVNENTFRYARVDQCRQINGRQFLTRTEAQTEYQRLTGRNIVEKVLCKFEEGYCQKENWLTRAECVAQGGQSFSSTRECWLAKGIASSDSSSTASTTEDRFWCVRPTGITKEIPEDCKDGGGEYFTSESSAETEYERLLSVSSKTSTTTQTAQTTTAQPPTVDKSALDLEFWQSVKDSDDPDMFREYLRQFPQGVYAGLAKLRIKKLGGTSTSVAQSSIPNLDYGDYYALVIGNNDYELLPDLETAVNDATKVASVLEYDYGFKVELLKNASRSEILKSLFGYRKIVGERDNLLIYYAGHGELDEGAKKGYWLPVDSARDDPSNWVMTDQVVAQITAMEAKHVMVVADSCFSGELTRGIKIDYGSPNWIQKLVKKKARIALTSGGLEPVSDSGGGSHSVFAKVFISLLEENTGVLNTQKLFTELRPRVMKNTRQTPEHGTIHLAGDDGGDFLFVRQ